MYRLSLKAQDELLLCTDGLHDMIPDDKLAVILNANATAEGACRNLVEAANTAGGNDNITVIVAKLLALKWIGRRHLSRPRCRWNN